MQTSIILPTLVDIAQYIPLHLPHDSPQCRHIATKQSAHIAWAMRTFWSLLCGCIAHQSPHPWHTIWERKCSLICSDLSRSIQTYTVMHDNAVLVLDREMLTFSHLNMQCGNGPLLAWSLVALWIVRDVMSSKKYLETHWNERSKQAYWSVWNYNILPAQRHSYRHKNTEKFSE